MAGFAVHEHGIGTGPGRVTSHLINVATGPVARGAVYSGAGERLVFTRLDGHVRILDVCACGARRETEIAPGGAVTSTAWSQPRETRDLVPRSA